MYQKKQSFTGRGREKPVALPVKPVETILL